MPAILPQLRPVLLADVPWDALFRIGLVAGELLVLVIFALTVVLFRLRARNRLRAGRWSRLEELWEPLLLEVVHGDRPPDVLQEQVPDGEREFFLRFLLGYAEKLRGEERERVKRLALPHLEVILPQLDRSDPERRAVAVRTLGALGLPEFAPQVVAALEDPAPLVRFSAAHGLLSDGTPEHAGEVVRRLDRFGSWTADALVALLSTAGGDVAPPLRVSLADPFTRPDTAAVAAHALRRIGDPHAADAAVTALEQRSERAVVVESLRLLGVVGHAAHAPLVRTFVDHPDFAIRAQAFGALGRLGREEDVESLVAAVSDSSPWVALRAARGLADMGRTDLLRRLGASEGEGAAFARQVAEETGR